MSTSLKVRNTRHTSVTMTNNSYPALPQHPTHHSPQRTFFQKMTIFFSKQLLFSSLSTGDGDATVAPLHALVTYYSLPYSRISLTCSEQVGKSNLWALSSWEVESTRRVMDTHCHPWMKSHLVLDYGSSTRVRIGRCQC